MSSEPSGIRPEDAVFFDSYPDALVATSDAGTILAWNRGAEAVFGFSAEEAVGSNLFDLIVSAEHLSHARAQLAEALAGGTTSYECVRRRKDGAVVYADTALRVHRDDRGAVRFVAFCKRDITRLKYMRESQALELKFRGLLDAAPDAMIIVNRDGRIILANQQVEVLFDYNRQDLLGQPMELLVPERFRDHHPAHRSGYFREPRPRPMGASLELYGRRKDGTEFPVEISLSPMEGDQGPLVTAAVRDITERKRLEERRRQADELARQQAQEANRLKSEFLANMSHELRTPLNAIIGFAQIMRDGKVGPVSGPHHEYLGDILNSSKHLLRLINDVLDLAKVEAGRMDFHPERVRPAALASEVRDSVRSLAASRRIDVVQEEEAGVEALIDPAKFKQVLYNYLSNALKFAPEDSRVVVRLCREGDDAFRLEVEDAGEGIRPEDLDRLFVEFQQLDASSAKRHQGTGLGLALTRRLVEAQGGRVGVRSQPGHGSVFWAALPLEVTSLGG